MKHATSLRMTGTVISKGESIKLDLRLARGRGCEGTVALAGRADFKMVVLGQALYLLPDRSFWQSIRRVNPAIPAEDVGKYLKTSVDSKTFAGLANICDPTKLAGAFEDPSLLAGTPAVRTTLNGRPAVQITDDTEASMWVAADSRMEILKIQADQGSLTFSGWNDPVRITTPRPGEIVAAPGL